jgi:hypothetical protein
MPPRGPKPKRIPSLLNELDTTLAPAVEASLLSPAAAEAQPEADAFALLDKMRPLVDHCRKIGDLLG